MSDYRNAVVAIVEYDGKILIGKKADSDHFLSGKWHIPGGMVNDSETEEQALIREMDEEANIKIRINEFLDEQVLYDRKIRARWYMCSYVSGEIKAGSDLSEAKFVPKYEALKLFSSKAVSLWPPKVMEYFEQKKA